MAKNSTIRLHVQTLNWSLIKNQSKLWKIFFQFDVNADNSGRKIFNLVAYPAYKNKGKCTIGKKIPLAIKKNTRVHELKLPLTLGNLEMKHTVMKSKFILNNNTLLEFTPKLYRANPHTMYSVSDGFGSLMANPSPPAPPQA